MPHDGQRFIPSVLTANRLSRLSSSDRLRSRRMIRYVASTPIAADTMSAIN